MYLLTKTITEYGTTKPIRQMQFALIASNGENIGD